MINIALLGLGVVGKGCADLLASNGDLIASRLGDCINVKYILDLRDFPGTPYEEKIVHDFEIIKNDPEIKLVAEMMGGSHPAYEYTKACLLMGKSVVTSNKELVAKFGTELLQIARENGVSFAFEASVGGGIPIIRPLSKDFLSNEIVEISGILNGTTNYILTEMLQKGASFADALAEAQARGYAERDPSADVDGIDTCRKICILTAMATGILPSSGEVLTEGIRTVERDDVSILEKNKAAVKLLGRMYIQDGKPCLIVAPFVIFDNCPLCHVNDVFNGIMVGGVQLGNTMFYGKGAGMSPTASAVCTDIIAILKDGDDSFAPVFHNATSADILPSFDFTCRRYLRTDAGTAAVEKIFGPVDVLAENAYITQNAFAECEFSKLSAPLGQFSALRVL